MLRRLLFPDAADGSTTVTAPVTEITPKADLPQLAKEPEVKEKPMPESMKDVTFSLDTYKVEQLAPTTAPDEKKETTTEVKKELETKKEPEVKKKEEPKKEEKSALPKFMKPPAGKEGEKKEEQVRQVQVPSAHQRDYSGFTPEQQTVLKQMSNPAFEFTKNLIAENKELKKLEGSTYLQHEQAYILDPEFQKAQADLLFARKEGEYWQQQLLLMKQGKPWRPITGFDEQGNPVIGEERQPNDADEERVRLYMNNCFSAIDNVNGTIQAFPSKYKSRLQSDMAAVENERKARFSWVSDPKLLEYSITIEGMRDRTIKQIREDFKELFPPYLRNHPALEVAADLMVALRIGHAELEQQKAERNVDSTIQKEQSLVEPSSKEKPAASKEKGKPVHGVTEFTIDPTFVRSR